MSGMRTVRTLVVTASAWLLMVMAGSISHAQGTKAQEERKTRLEREIAILDKQLRDNASKSSNALNSLSLTRKKIASRKELVAESDQEIAALSRKINAKQAEANRLQSRLDTLSSHYAKLIRNAYKMRDSKIWYMYILASEDLGQAFRRTGYMKNLASDMNRQGEKIGQTKDELKRETDSLATLRSAAQELRSKRAFEVSTLQAEEAQSAKLVSQLQRNKSKYQKGLAAKKRQMEALNREIERLISSAVKESKGGTEKKAIDYKLDAEFSKNKGKLPWPAEGPIVDHFGQIYNQVFKSVKLPNNGINIALGKDTAIKAVFDGVVKQTGVIPGYNKCVLVQHGNYFSFYCKIGSVAVKSGDKVKTGDIIGTVDTIDGLTQLHFEIWKGTTPQNPESWLR